MWAEMRPDCYGGSEFDSHIPGWHTYGEGDKEGTDGEKEIVLAASVFPPGTRVVISEPVCPECDFPRIPRTENNEIRFPDLCDCGFDWKSWTEGNYG